MYAPVRLSGENNTGAEIGVVFIDSTEDYGRYVSSPSFYDFIKIPFGYFNIKVDKPFRKVIVKILNGTAASDLELDFWEYKSIKW